MDIVTNMAKQKGNSSELRYVR